MNTLQFMESVMETKIATDLEDVFNVFQKSAQKKTPELSKEKLYEGFYAPSYFDPLTSWWKDKINIKTLLSLENFMNINPWIKKLACNCKNHCINYESGLCPSCPQNVPTLEKIITNMHNNINSPHYDRIINIQKLYQEGTLTKDDAFIILVDFDDRPYMYDGNHRLIAFADNCFGDFDITIFFGVKTGTIVQ